MTFNPLAPALMALSYLTGCTSEKPTTDSFIQPPVNTDDTGDTGSIPDCTDNVCLRDYDYSVMTVTDIPDPNLNPDSYQMPQAEGGDWYAAWATREFCREPLHLLLRTSPDTAPEATDPPASPIECYANLDFWPEHNFDIDQSAPTIELSDFGMIFHKIGASHFSNITETSADFSYEPPQNGDGGDIPIICRRVGDGLDVSGLIYLDYSTWIEPSRCPNAN